MQFPEKHIFVCVHQRDANAPQASCANSGGGEIRARLKERLLEKGLHKTYRVNTAGCLGKCGCGPTLVIYPAGIWYGRVTLNDVDEIIKKSILDNEVIERLDLKK